MNELLDRLSQNYELDVCDIFENMIHQKVARVIICNKAYSILQQDNNLYEIVHSTTVKQEGLQLPFQQPDIAFHTLSNLTADEVVNVITELSSDYLMTVFQNPILSKHGIQM